MGSLVILLPLTLKSGQLSAASLTEGLKQLREGFGDFSSQIRVIIGIDEDDEQIHQALPDIIDCFSDLLTKWATVKVFTTSELDQRPPGPICWMWDRLAKEAMMQGHEDDLILLLGVSYDANSDIAGGMLSFTIVS